MNDFGKLLVPVDYSESDREVLRYAADLAARLGGEIVVVHVVQPEQPMVPDYFGPVPGYDLSNGSQVSDASTYLGELEPLMTQVPHRVLVLTGSPGAQILAAAEQENAALIVMPTHGRNALRHLMMGSTTEEVLRHSPVPVLAVRSAVLSSLETSHQPG